VVNDEVLAVIDAEALASELAGVIAGAKAQKTDDDVVRSRERERRSSGTARLEVRHEIKTRPRRCLQLPCSAFFTPHLLPHGLSSSNRIHEVNRRSPDASAWR
jgi:hypothetical protein